VIKFYRLSSLTSILRRAGLAFACLASAGVGIASAVVPVVQGRWEFVVTSGDNASQLSTMGNPSLALICFRLRQHGIDKHFPIHL